MQSNKDEPIIVQLDADQQGHFIVLLTNQINKITAKVTVDASNEEGEDTDGPGYVIIEDYSVENLVEAMNDLVFNATLVGHVLDNHVDSNSYDYLLALEDNMKSISEITNKILAAGYQEPEVYCIAGHYYVEHPGTGELIEGKPYKTMKYIPYPSPEELKED